MLNFKRVAFLQRMVCAVDVLVVRPHTPWVGKVLLRLQPPNVDLQTLELGNSRVLCAAASPDNTLLAVGCERGDGTGTSRRACPCSLK